MENIDKTIEKMLIEHIEDFVLNKFEIGSLKKYSDWSIFSTIANDCSDSCSCSDDCLFEIVFNTHGAKITFYSFFIHQFEISIRNKKDTTYMRASVGQGVSEKEIKLKEEVVDKLLDIHKELFD